MAVILFLLPNNIFAQDNELAGSIVLRHQAMDEEVRKFGALRDEKIDETVNRISGKKPKPQFFFMLQSRAAKPLGLNLTMLSNSFLFKIPATHSTLISNPRPKREKSLLRPNPPIEADYYLRRS